MRPSAGSSIPQGWVPQEDAEDRGRRIQDLGHRVERAAHRFANPGAPSVGTTRLE